MEDKGLRPQLAKKHGPARTGCGFFSSRLALYHESNFNPEKKGTVRDSTKLHATVPFGASGGLEPSRREAPDPKSGASAIPPHSQVPFYSTMLPPIGQTKIWYHISIYIIKGIEI